VETDEEKGEGRKARESRTADGIRYTVAMSNVFVVVLCLYVWVVWYSFRSMRKGDVRCTMYDGLCVCVLCVGFDVGSSCLPSISTLQFALGR
jgi:hypothetical protein